MSLPFSVYKWLRPPSRIAFLLGLGMLSTAGTKVGTAEAHPGTDAIQVPQQSDAVFGELRIWNDGGRLYIADGGRAAQELRLGDTPEARRLRDLLERNGVPSVALNRMLLAGGGGNGISWAPAGESTANRSRTLPVDDSSSKRQSPSTETGAPARTRLPAGKTVAAPSSKG
jgi:hypothetical protein